MSSEVPIPSPGDNTMSVPVAPFAAPADRPASRPLSEISDNSDRRRSSARSLKGDKPSRPTSEVREAESAKRLSGSIPLQTITVNLVDYAGTVSAKGPASTVSIPSSATAQPSPGTKPATLRAEKPVEATGVQTARPVSTVSVEEEGSTTESSSSQPADGASSLLMAKRAALRPSPLGGASYADVAKPTLSPTLSSGGDSFGSPRSSSELPPKPPAKSKPSWLRRASGTAALRSKSKSPVPKDDISLSASTSSPPVLPPRKGGTTTTSAGSLSEQARSPLSSMPPPELPEKSSYATVAAAGPSRSRLGDGEGRPAFSPSIGPRLPPRDKDSVGNIRGRLAAWTSAAQSSSSFSRSESSTSFASTSNPSTLASAQQRLPTSAQRVLGNAGTAVQKGWAGLRSRGVTGSISGMSSLASSGRRGSMDPSGSWTPGLARGGVRDRTQSADYDLRTNASDGPIFQQGVVLRVGGDRTGRVFGKDLVDVGRVWGVMEATTLGQGETEWERRRKQCLPALVVRCVEYLEIWGPKEEGIFRISGRSSHISRLRKEFDAGADLDLKQCHPGDLDPHAVASIFKTYLRELSSPLLTIALAPKFDNWARTRQKEPSSQDTQATAGQGKSASDELPTLLRQLPSAHWFLLADIVKLLDLIPKHAQVNRMTLNAVMLSLGPSLNISGGVLTELLDKREILFASPPPVSGTESANSIIDFGDISITPPMDPASSEPVQTPRSTLSQPDDSLQAAGKTKNPSRPTSKPSLTRLFSSGTGLVSKQASAETLRSARSIIVDVTPPRVDLRTSSTEPLPSFESEKAGSSTQPAELSQAPASSESIPEDVEPIDCEVRSATSEDRSRPNSSPNSTPIADKYKSTGAQFPALRPARLSSGMESTSASLQTIMNDGSMPRLGDVQGNGGSANPATVIRRGSPVFFQSTGTNDRHSRLSASSTGTKRKEDSPLQGDPSTGTEGADEARTKRLSSGPGPTNVREAVRTMEMTA